jgi:dihydrofolate synthase/folylpolyglutamate synthase
MSYSETINYLYNLQKHGIKFGLDNINTLMSALDNPHKSFSAVHVAGTNGKGSTSAIIASILHTARLRVGLFTSPHLISFTERIRVNNEEITEKEVVELTEEIRTKIHNTPSLTLPPRGGGMGGGDDSELNPTFFEVVTAMAMLYFKRKKVDIAVIEVGMGGRLDATNIIVPEVSVITNISYDHKEFLGNTLREIANEKAGIIKEGVPVVISYQELEAMEVIEKKVKEKGAELYTYGRDFSSVLKKEDLTGIYFDYWDGDSSAIHDLHLPLIGEHQLQNASIAIKAAMIVLQNKMQDTRYTPLCPPLLRGELKGGYYHESCIRDGLSRVRWPGRLELIKEDPPILIDGAHNPSAAVALSQVLKKIFLGKYRIIMVLGIMGDKDIEGIMKPLLPLASEIILTAPQYERAASPYRLADVAASLGFTNVRIAPSVKDAIEMATKESSNNPPSPPFTKGGSRGIHHSSLIVVTGSFYTIGEAKEAIGQKGVLARLRE